MPAVSKAQQMFFGAELARKRAGKKTKMSKQQLEEFAGTERKNLPTRADVKDYVKRHKRKK
jgi:hypothetical protein